MMRPGFPPRLQPAAQKPLTGKMGRAARRILKVLEPMSCCRRRRILKAVTILSQEPCCPP